MGLLNRGGINRIGPSRFNFGGIGRWMFKRMMKDHKITQLEELRKTAIELGVSCIRAKRAWRSWRSRAKTLLTK